MSMTTKYIAVIEIEHEEGDEPNIQDIAIEIETRMYANGGGFRVEEATIYEDVNDLAFDIMVGNI